jgi:hypothetical protein
VASPDRFASGPRGDQEQNNSNPTTFLNKTEDRKCEKLWTLPEPRIGHLKNEHRFKRNRSKGDAGDAIHAILSAAAMNFHKLLGAFGRIFLRRLSRIWSWISPLQGLLPLHTHPLNA